MSALLHIIGALISIYLLVITVRILLTWFGGIDFGRPMVILAQITDPYLNLFRRPARRISRGIDLSPVLAIVVLWIAANIVNTLAATGRISFGIILAIITIGVAQAVGFFLGLFLILAVVRLIGLFANVSSAGRFWLTLDHIVEPLVYRFTKFFLRSGDPTYRTGLFIFGGSMLGALIVGKIIENLLVGVFSRLPF